MKWWRDTFVGISIAIDVMLAPSVKMQGCDGLKLLPGELVVAVVSNTIPE